MTDAVEDWLGPVRSLTRVVPVEVEVGGGAAGARFVLTSLELWTHQVVAQAVIVITNPASPGALMHAVSVSYDGQPAGMLGAHGGGDGRDMRWSAMFDPPSPGAQSLELFAFGESVLTVPL